MASNIAAAAAAAAAAVAAAAAAVVAAAAAAAAVIGVDFRATVAIAVIGVDFCAAAAAAGAATSTLFVIFVVVVLALSRSATNDLYEFFFCAVLGLVQGLGLVLILVVTGCRFAAAVFYGGALVVILFVFVFGVVSLGFLASALVIAGAVDDSFVWLLSQGV